MKASRIITGCVIAAAIVAVAALGTLWGLNQTASAQLDVSLIHLNPDGTDFTGNLYCPQTVWSADGEIATPDPEHDCNNITSQKHVIRTDSPGLTIPAGTFTIEGVGVIVAQGPCNSISELTGRLGWCDDDGDGVCDEDGDNEGVDDDGDGLIDEDPTANGFDDDDDGTEDGAGATPGSGDCDDGVDNDGDGTDMNDPQCWAFIDEDPGGDANGDGCPGICGVDDDGDTLVDEGDPYDDDEDGSVDEDPIDGVDNDDDGTEYGWGTLPGSGNCDDGVDNDGNGTDLGNDPQCAAFDGEDPYDYDDDGDGFWDEDPPGNGDPDLADEYCVVIHSNDPGETSIRFVYDDVWTDAIYKEWDKLEDTVILKKDDVDKKVGVPGIGSVELPKDANSNDKRDAQDAHLLDRNGETQDHAVIWDEALKRDRSAEGPIRIIEVVHGYHAEMPDHPTEGAVILAFIDSPGCTYFTNPVAVDIDLDGLPDYQAGEIDLGTAMVGISDWRGFFVGPKQWPAGAQLSAEALAAAEAHLLVPGESNNGDLPFFEADYAGVYIDTFCEEQATITFHVGYPDYVQSVPEIPEIEAITINWTTIQMAKQPQIRWAGEEIVLEKRWALPGEWYPEAGGIDNDGDGKINEDCGCILDDDDGDGLWDEDPRNGVDDDGDRKEDGTQGTPGDYECADGIDNDADGKADGADPECQALAGPGIDEDLPDDDGDGLIDEDPLDLCPRAGEYVKYVKLDGPGGLVAGLPDVLPPGGSEPDEVWTYIDEECVSRALYSSEEPGEVNAEAIVDTSSPSNKHAFLVWYIKVYELKLENIPLADGVGRKLHNDGEWDGESPITSEGTEAETLNVSQDALLRVRVKGWFYGGDLSGEGDVLASGRGHVCIDMDGDGDEAGSAPGEPYPGTPAMGCADADDEFVAAGHWVLPDDLPLLAGPHPDRLASWDVMSEPDVPALDIIGTKSALDSHDDTLRQVVPCVQPKTIGGIVVPDWTCKRKTVDPDGQITEADALMPPLKVLAEIATDDAGFLKPAAKSADVGIDSAYQSEMIPASSFIPPKVGSGGYAWDSWGWNVYQYDYPFFQELFKTTQDGFIRSFEFYTDNRGEGFFFANGDYNLSFDDCRTDAVTGTPDCRPGDVVGKSVVTVIGDYPYFRKHPAVLANPVTKTWEWGGFKTVTAEALDPNHTAIIAHLKDRDGYCKWDVDYPEVTFSPSLNPVQLEEIEFILNTEVGSIIEISSNGLYSPPPPHTPLDDGIVVGAEEGVIINLSHAVTLAEDVRVLAGLEAAGLADVGARAHVEDGECQAWVVIEHPLGEEPDVSVRFHDPEGVITRHWPPLELMVHLVPGWNDSCYVGPEDDIEDILTDAGIVDHVLAVYRLTTEHIWERYFPDQPDISTITTLNPYDQLFVLMTASATWAQEISALPISVDLVEGWNSVCYAGADRATEESTANIEDDLSILLTYGPDQQWRRYMPNQPDIPDTLTTLDMFDSVILLITAEGGTTWVFDPPAIPTHAGPVVLSPTGTAPADLTLPTPPISPEETCAPVFPGTYYGAVTIDGWPAADGTTVGAIIDGVVWAVTVTSGGRYVFEVPAALPVSPPCFSAGTLTFTCDGATAAESDTWAAGPRELDLTCGEPSPGVTVRVDQGISIEALAVPAPGLGAFTIDATYDPSALTLAECSADPAGSFEMALCSPDYGPNTIRTTGIRPECGLVGDVPLADLTFDPAPPVCPDDLLVSVETLADCDGSDLSPIVDHKWWVGDADRDFDKDAVDAMFILQYVVGLRDGSDQCPPPPGAIHLPSADADCDGDVDAVDAMFVLQHVVGLRPVLCPAS